MSTNSGPVTGRSTVHLPDDATHPAYRSAPSWAVAMPEPPGVEPGSSRPAPDPAAPHPAIRWVRGVLTGIGLGTLGAVLYVSLAVLVGVEIYPAVIVTGILCGAGLRAGGVGSNVIACVVSAVLALAFLWVGGALAQACLTAMATDGNLGAALAPWVRDPVAASAGLFTGPMLAAVLVALTSAGAVLATLAYGDRTRG